MHCTEEIKPLAQAVSRVPGASAWGLVVFSEVSSIESGNG